MRPREGYREKLKEDDTVAEKIVWRRLQMSAAGKA
jgi:hypothetical protein